MRYSQDTVRYTLTVRELVDLGREYWTLCPHAPALVLVLLDAPRHNWGGFDVPSGENEDLQRVLGWICATETRWGRRMHVLVAISDRNVRGELAPGSHRPASELGQNSPSHDHQPTSCLYLARIHSLTALIIRTSSPAPSTSLKLLARRPTTTAARHHSLPSDPFQLVACTLQAHATTSPAPNKFLLLDFFCLPLIPRRLSLGPSHPRRRFCAARLAPHQTLHAQRPPLLAATSVADRAA